MGGYHDALNAVHEALRNYGVEYGEILTSSNLVLSKAVVEGLEAVFTECFESGMEASDTHVVGEDDDFALWWTSN